MPAAGDCRGPEAPKHCKLCPRLVAFRAEIQSKTSDDWFNGAVPSFGDEKARLLIAGLAPGLNGANRTGRPFTGDYAGDLLYATLLKYGFASGHYDARPDDGLHLVDCIISNSVRCVPPQNKPTPQEIATCNGFLKARMDALPNVRVIIALGRVAHESVLMALGLRRSQHGFAHGAWHQLRPGLSMIDSFHCSRYNTNTRRLTTEMFHAVFDEARAALKRSGAPALNRP